MGIRIEPISVQSDTLAMLAGNDKAIYTAPGMAEAEKRALYIHEFKNQ